MCCILVHVIKIVHNFNLPFLFSAISYPLFPPRLISYPLLPPGLISYPLFPPRLISYPLFPPRLISYPLFPPRLISYPLPPPGLISYPLFPPRLISYPIVPLNSFPKVIHLIAVIRWRLAVKAAFCWQYCWPNIDKWCCLHVIWLIGAT